MLESTFGRAAAWLTIAPMAVACPLYATASLVINELHPDPEGSDSGREFVELFNSGDEPVDLEGVQLQFANGAEEANWQNRWTGLAGEILESGEFWLIVDRNWQGAELPDAMVSLGLQNGPDAIRIHREGGTLDLVGYGLLTDPDLLEGESVPLVPGSSLARRPDGRDTGNNRDDLVPAEPTPGTRNFHPWALKTVEWRADPPSLDRPDEHVHLSVLLKNEGTESWPFVRPLLRMGDQTYPGLLDGLAADASVRLDWSVRPERNGTLAVEINLDDGPAPLVVPVGRFQVGPSDLVVNEVLGDPSQGQGEWIEILAAGKDSLFLADYQIRDEDGGFHLLPEARLAPGELAVLAQDSTSLDGWIRDNELLSPCGTGNLEWNILKLSGWPSLNNSPPDDRDYADRILLGRVDGTVIDHVTLGGLERLISGPVGDGVSLERRAVAPSNPAASNWSPCTARTGSTPGCPNSVAGSPATDASLTVEPQILDPDRGDSVLHLRFQVTEPGHGWELRIFDLWGQLVRDLGSDSRGPGPRDILWDGTGDQGGVSGSGAYVALLEIRSAAGALLVREKALIVVP